MASRRRIERKEFFTTTNDQREDIYLIDVVSRLTDRTPAEILQATYDGETTEEVYER